MTGRRGRVAIVERVVAVYAGLEGGVAVAVVEPGVKRAGDGEAASERIVAVVSAYGVQTRRYRVCLFATAVPGTDNACMAGVMGQTYMCSHHPAALGPSRQPFRPGHQHSSSSAPHHLGEVRRGKERSEGSHRNWLDRQQYV